MSIAVFSKIPDPFMEDFVFDRLYDIVTQKCGAGAADTVRGFGTEQYPLVVVIMKNRSCLEVSAVLQGNLFNHV